MKIFSTLNKNKATINGILITLSSSLLFNYLSDISESIFTDPLFVLKKLYNLSSFNCLATWLSLLILIVFNLYCHIEKKKINKETLPEGFYPLMLEHTDERIRDSVEHGVLSWGLGKSVALTNEMMFGWKSKDIVVESYDDSLFSFLLTDNIFSNEGWQEYRDGEAFSVVKRMGNNLPRFMLKSIRRKNGSLLLDLSRTEWSQTKYRWNGFDKRQKDPFGDSLMKKKALEVKKDFIPLSPLPNSLCMHLLLETKDGRVVLSKISRLKINDFPGTLAATLGEQIDISDFTDGNVFKHGFVIDWLRRAFEEEYKLSDYSYDSIVDESTFRILSLNFEGDIYNFALLCTVKLRLKFDEFNRKVGLLLSTEEAIELIPLKIMDIPKTLFLEKIDSSSFHPSTHLRLMIFFFYKMGYKKGGALIMKEAKYFNKDK